MDDVEANNLYSKQLLKGRGENRYLIQMIHN